ncbi:cell division protein ZapA [Oscillospiraceae bacterium PP1C4]
MNALNRVRISINGVHYSINTVEPEDYVHGLAQELDEQIKGVIEKSPSVSFNDVMVLCAINYIDAYKRSEENADRMRTQITEYLEDAAKARIELDEVKRENAILRRQLEDNKRENVNLRRQLDELRANSPLKDLKI